MKKFFVRAFGSKWKKTLPFRQHQTLCSKYHRQKMLLHFRFILLAATHVVHPLLCLLPPKSINFPQELTRRLSQTTPLIPSLKPLEALPSKLLSASYGAPDICRIQALSQTYNLKSPGQSATSGYSWSIVLRLLGNNPQARVDQFSISNDYAIWAFPDLEPAIDINYVLMDAVYGCVCVTENPKRFVCKPH